jgi:hypothetical protein
MYAVEAVCSSGCAGAMEIDDEEESDEESEEEMFGPPAPRVSHRSGGPRTRATTGASTAVAAPIPHRPTAEAVTAGADSVSFERPKVGLPSLPAGRIVAWDQMGMSSATGRVVASIDRPTPTPLQTTFTPKPAGTCVYPSIFFLSPHCSLIHRASHSLIAVLSSPLASLLQ